MQTTSKHRVTPPTSPDKLTPLASETRFAITTAEAAAHLGRQPQTLRTWACLGNGPLKPLRVNGRLLWGTGDLKRVLGVAA